MFTSTTILAVRALVQVAVHGDELISPRRIATELGESPAYLAKVARELVKSGILRAEKGVNGGVKLAKPTSSVSLLDIRQSCQGPLLVRHCEVKSETGVCPWHEVAAEVHLAMVGILSRWTLADMVSGLPAPSEQRATECLMLKGSRAAKSAMEERRE